MSTDHRIGRADEIPEGQGRAYLVGGREIVVFNIEGDFRAVERHCVPRGMALERGVVSEGEILCPHHGWMFDLRDGRCSMAPNAQTPIFPVRVAGDDLFVTV